MAKESKEWKNKLADIQAPRDPRADGLGLGDYFALHAGFIVPEGFPAGTIAPASIPDSESRKRLRQRLTGELATWDHETLARVAATLLEGTFLWRGTFAKYAIDKKIELCEAKAALYQRLYKANTEALDILSDPGTRAYLNAMAKLAKDPKQAAKAEALELWKAWKGGKSLHKSGAAFHRFVCDQFPIITSTKTVERWCREWSKEAKIGTELAAFPSS